MSDKKTLLQDMELFKTDEYYILLNSEASLWCNRKTGELEAKPAWELATSGDPECLGVFHGLVGKVDFQSQFESRLVLIKDVAEVGQLPDSRTVVKIRTVAFLHVCGSDVTTSELGLKTCKKHRGGRTGDIGGFELPQKAAFGKAWGAMKSATSSIKNTTQQAAALATYQVKGGGNRKENKDREKFEKRILEELQRVFNESESFYFCCGPPGSSLCDLTNTLQRASVPDAAMDDRFFWNKYMLKDIIELNNEYARAWTLPIIQGFVQIEKCSIEIDSSPVNNDRFENFTIVLISRRSRYRAGTRYKRRGLDEDGKCANYVETEQVVTTKDYQVSFVQVRGSVPLFWSQPGYKYRPPPLIDKGEAETKVAFEKHMAEEIQCYGPVCIVNLVEQTGKEKVIWDGFTQQVLEYDSPHVTYASFDFHEHCRGLRFENVAILIAKLEDVVHEMGFFWKDCQGVICEQNGVFRVNCMDCLDRTNVVQTALAKAVLEIQLTKLGLLPPEGLLPISVRSKFQLLWANNGDLISKQYAGTNALKGDYTRTGERKLAGMVKDGMNSANRYVRRLLLDELLQGAIDVMQGVPVIETPHMAQFLAQDVVDFINSPSYYPQSTLEHELLMSVALFNVSRYYLSRFKDAYRQATIDTMQGVAVSDDIGAEDEADAAASAEHVKHLIEDCKKLLVSDTSLVLGAWGLINADPVSGDPTETEIDTVLILTRDSYYVADYDEDADKITKYQRVPLADLFMVELGPSDFNSSTSALQIFNKAKNRQSHHCLRFRYRIEPNSEYSHTFRSTNLRFFNNMAVVIKTEEEMIESLRAICDCFRVAFDICEDTSVSWHIGAPLTKLNTPSPQHVNNQSSSLHVFPSISRNVSETQLGSIKSVGRTALSNMTSTFNKLGHSLNPTRKNSGSNKDPSTKTTEFTIGGDHSSSEDDDVVCGGMRERETNGTTNTPGGQSSEAFLPNVGIVMSNASFQQGEIDADDIHISTDAPEIRVESSITTKDRKVPTTLQVRPNASEMRVRTFSHSSGEVDAAPAASGDKQHLDVTRPLDPHMGKSNSEKDLLLSITASQSENALRSIKSGFSTATNVLTSPSAVLSPLSKLAKGVQVLGANLDPRKLGKGRPMALNTSIVSPESNRLKEIWESQKCKSRLIAV